MPADPRQQAHTSGLGWAFVRVSAAAAVRGYARRARKRPAAGSDRRPSTADGRPDTGMGATTRRPTPMRQGQGSGMSLRTRSSSVSRRTRTCDAPSVTRTIAGRGSRL